MVAGRLGWLFLALNAVPFGLSACGGSSMEGDEERADRGLPTGGAAGTGSTKGGAGGATAGAGGADAGVPPGPTLGDVLGEQADCAVGQDAYALDEDGDGWAARGSSVLCLSDPREGYEPVSSIIGFDCNDRDSALTRELYRAPTPEERRTSPLPGPARRCLEEEDTTGYEPLPDLFSYWGDYNCSMGFDRFGRDRDRDGVVQNEPDFLCVPRGRSPGEGFANGLYAVSWEYRDCDDLDPTLSVFGFVDADRDDYALGGPTCIVPGAPGVIGLGQSAGDDCDDENPLAYRILYVDADGDGARSETQACVGDPPPSGLVVAASPTDCDDGDASVHPGAEELVFGDGIDQDCDRADAPSCEAIEAGLPDDAIDIEPACTGEPDLFVVWGRGCPVENSCNLSTFEVRIGNRGGDRFTGTLGIELVRRTSALTFPVTLDLASGELSDVMELPEQDGGEVEARLELEAPDCQDDAALPLYLLGGSACRP